MKLKFAVSGKSLQSMILQFATNLFKYYFIHALVGPTFCSVDNLGKGKGINAFFALEIRLNENYLNKPRFSVNGNTEN